MYGNESMKYNAALDYCHVRYLNGHVSYQYMHHTMI